MVYNSDLDDLKRDGPTTVEYFPDMAQFHDLAEPQETEDFLSTQWALVKIGTFQSRLEAIQSSRDRRRFRTSGSSMSSISSLVIYELANQVFGFNGWSHEIIDCELLQEENSKENETEKYSATFSALVRLVLKDGTANEAHGLGSSCNLPFKYMSYNKAKKQAVTEATKNAILGLRDILLDLELKQLEAELTMKYEQSRV